ncbi:MAG TPA: phosphosulfolactate synthase [Solirubrobacteraceae bacterium]|jgi:phosphosulfolactate synthase
MDLLELPRRSAKPREHGITHVLDKGMSLSEVDGLVEVAGEYVDVVKLGWGTALATLNLETKLERYREHGIPVVLGGSLTELAIAQGRLERLVAWVHDLGLTHFEISDGTIVLEPQRKLELVRQLAQEFTVLSEVGSKDDTGAITPPYLWVEQMHAQLEAGAWKVIAEGRESGSAGIFRPTGEVREGLINEIVHGVDAGQIMFDAPRKEQQVWFVKRFGPDVNLGNIAPADVLALETLRLGLRSDTMGAPGRE